MQKFLYVFAEADRDTLIKAGYCLLKADDANKIYVFDNRGEECFALNVTEYLFSDTLTF